jgi:triphosphoribosyl-dephospho-CoA synthase
LRQNHGCCGTTGQVNTHRGAIFALGLLAAAAGLASSYGHPPTDATLRNMIALRWRRELLAVPAPAASGPTHGQQVAARYGASGAHGEAIDGFPAVFDVALPALRFAISRGADCSTLPDSTRSSRCSLASTTPMFLYRGGAEPARRLKAVPRTFLAAGSVFAADWEAASRNGCIAELERGLSPGGMRLICSPAAVFVDQWQAAEA